MKLELIAKHEKDSRACRDAFALTLKDMMAADKSVCYVDCDLMGCVNTKQLMAAYPDRAYEAGIAEANAAGVCAGLAATGKKVYLHTFGTFASRRIYDQVENEKTIAAVREVVTLENKKISVEDFRELK